MIFRFLEGLKMGGTTDINGGTIDTSNAGGGSGNQTYTGDVRLGANATLTGESTGTRAAKRLWRLTSVTVRLIVSSCVLAMGYSLHSVQFSKVTTTPLPAGAGNVPGLTTNRPGRFLHFSKRGSRHRIPRTPPTAGADTDDVLRSVGLTGSRVEELRRTGACA